MSKLFKSKVQRKAEKAHAELQKKVHPAGHAARVTTPEPKEAAAVTLGVEPRLMGNPLSVIPGTTAYMDLPVGVTYRNIAVVCGGTTLGLAQMTGVRVKCNDEAIWNLTSTDLDNLNQFDKQIAFATNKVLDINFMRVGMKNPLDAAATALCTGRGPTKQARGGIGKLRLEIDLAGSAVAPTMVVYADVTDANAAQAHALFRREQYFETIPAGPLEWTFQNKFNADSLRPGLSRFAFKAAKTELTAFRFLTNGKELVNRLSGYNEGRQQRENLRSPQSGYVIYDTNEDGASHPELVGNIGQLDVKTTMVAGSEAPLTVIVDTLGTL